MTHWDHTTEVLVVGTGGGAMTAALVAKQAGLDVLMIEKTEYYGGSTAISGGGLWVPNNFPLQHAGRVDAQRGQQHGQLSVCWWLCCRRPG